MARNKKHKSAKRALRGLPSKQEILEYISQNPSMAGKREIGRAFGIKGAAKIDLKAMLKEMAEEGLIEKRGKRLQKPGALPPVSILDIVTRDRNGGLLAKPVDFEGDEAPVVEIMVQKNKGSETAGIGSRVLARISENREKGAQYIGKIIKVLEHQRRLDLGILRFQKGDKEARLVPVNRKQSEIIIPLDQIGEAKNGDLVEVEAAKSRRHYGLKRGKVINVLGSLDNEKAVSMIAIHAHGIPHVFPETVLAEAKNAKPLSGKETSHEDWRDVPLVTIDPADAKDHDDAIFGEEDPDNPGGFIATVAIADVSFYVQSGSALDREALLRGNSVYFPDRVVPMLPERISNDLCSLREQEDRPALAVKMWFDKTGKKQRHSFHRIIMRSHAKLAYEEAQAAIDGDPNDKAKPLLETILKPLWAAYACLKKGRNNRQPLELDLPERKIILKKDGTVDRVKTPERLDAHKLVEEFMIQANVCAAETLINKQQNLIFRVHDRPSLDKMEALGEFLHSLNIPLAKAGNITAQHFNSILAGIKGKDNEELVNQVVLRSQSQAEYSPDNIGHFGLNLPRYAHFTSPIRRYADLIVHRALVFALKLGSGGLTGEEEAQLDVIAADISMTERRAVGAERDTIDRLIAGFLSERIGERFSGRISGVTNAGLFIALDDTGADGFVPISRLGDEYYHFDASSHSLIGEMSALAYQMGMKVEVRLAEAAPIAGALRFEMLSEGIPSKGLPRSRRTNQRPTGQRGAGLKPGRKFSKKRHGHKRRQKTKR